MSLSSCPQALLQQQLASGYTGLPGSAQEQATLAALGALDPSMLGAHLTSALPQHALGPRLSAMGSGMGSGLSGMGSAQQQHAGLPSTPSVGGGAGVSALLGMTPTSPGPMGRYSHSGVGFGAGGALGGQSHAPRSSYSGGALDGGGPGSYTQYRVSSSGSGLLGGAPGGSGSGLGGLGPIGPSAGATGREGLFLDAYSQQHQQQQAGLMSPTWGGMRAGGGAAQRWPQQFLCPLSHQLMSDPVVAADGVTYQREAINDWMRLRDVSPVTGNPLGSAVLQPDFGLRAAIAAEISKVQGAGGFV